MPRPHSTESKPQNYDLIVSEAKANKDTKLYKEKGKQLPDDRISQVIGKSLAELIETADLQPITLSDTKAVKQATVRYFEACREASTVPTISGYARSMGISRQAIYDFLKHSPNSASAKWILIVKDSMADILSESALLNQVQPVVSIFLLKSLYEYQDKQVVDLQSNIHETPLDSLPDIEDVENKYSKYMADLPREAFEVND